MKKTMIYLSEEQQLLLKERAREKGVSMAALIREAVDGYLVREKPAVDYMAIVGIAEGAPGDRTSERVDEAMAKIVGDEDQARRPVPPKRKKAG